MDLYLIILVNKTKIMEQLTNFVVFWRSFWEDYRENSKGKQSLKKAVNL